MLNSGAEIWAKMAKNGCFSSTKNGRLVLKNAGPSQKPPYPFEKTWR